MSRMKKKEIGYKEPKPKKPTKPKEEKTQGEKK